MSGYIENIVFYEGYMPEHPVQKLLPDGSISIILDMQEAVKKLYNNEDLSKFKEFKGSFVSGQHKEFIHIEAAKNSSMMVLRFHPGKAYPFFNFPISKLNNKVVHLEEFWGNEIEQVRKKIIKEKAIDKKFSLLVDYLQAKIDKSVVEDKNFSSILKFLTETPHLATTKELAKRMAISQKHLISLFGKQVGLTPKALARIFRFQKVITQIEEQKEIDWLQITYDCGYYDQAHFIKDFYAFSGIKPSVYPNQRGEYLNYLPVK